MRDAETALERLLPVAQEAGGKFDLETYRRLVDRVGADAIREVVEGLVDGQPAPALRLAAAAVQNGVDERDALGEVLEQLRALLLLKVDGEDTGLVEQTGSTRQRLVELAGRVEVAGLEAMIQAGLVGRDRIRRLEDRRLVLELTLLRMARAGELPELGQLVAAVRSGTAVAPSAAAGAAAPAVVAPGGGLRESLIARLRDEMPLMVRTMEQCRVTGPDGSGTVTITLQTDRKMHRDRLQSRGVQDTLRGLLRNLLGAETTLSIDTPGGPDVAARAEPAPPDAVPGPGVQKVVDKFDGQILSQDQVDPESR